MIQKLITKYWPLLVLILAPSALLFPLFLGLSMVPAHLLSDVAPWRSNDPNSLVPWNVLQFDGIAQFYPWRKFAAESLRSGFIPLWNPYEFCGYPFLANSQSAVFYPPNLIFTILPIASAFGLSALLHLISGGLFLYLFARRALRMSKTGAVLAGVVWQLSTWQVSWLALPSFLDTSIWIPLALLFTHGLVKSPNLSNASKLGAALGLMMLAGHLQIALYGLGITLSYALALLLRKSKNSGRIIAFGVFAGGLMFMLCAPQLLPALELSRSSHRSASPPSESGYKSYVSNAMPAGQLISLYMPRIFGLPSVKAIYSDSSSVYRGRSSYWPALNYAETACYLGIAPLFLAFLGVGGRFRRSGTTQFFTVAALLSMAFALGTPLNKLLYYGIPGFSQTGSPARILLLWGLSVAILAGIGLDCLLERIFKSDSQNASSESLDAPSKLKPVLSILLPFVGYLVCGFVCAAFGIVSVKKLLGDSGSSLVISDLADIRVLFACFLAMLGIVFFAFRRRISRGAVGIALILISAFDLLAINQGYNSFAPNSAIYPEAGVVSWLKSHVGASRILPVNRSWSLAFAPVNTVLPPNAATFYGFHEAQGYDSLQTAQYKSFAKQMNGGASPSPPENGNMVMISSPSPDISLASVKYLVSAYPMPSLGSLVYDGGDAVVYENSAALPRVYSLPKLGALPFRELSPNSLRIDSNVNGNIVVSDQWTPGWTALEDCAPLKIKEAPYVFRTIENAHRGSIDIMYQPESFKLGLYLALAALAFLTGLIAVCATVRERLVPEKAG